MMTRARKNHANRSSSTRPERLSNANSSSLAVSGCWPLASGILNQIERWVVRRKTRPVILARANSDIDSRSSLVRSPFLGTTIALAFTAMAALSNSALAQNTLAQRVANAPDGLVRVQFAARPGTCGDGRDLIGYRKALFAESFQSIGDWNAPNCRPGPVRVAISVAGGKLTSVKTQVAGDWPRTSERVTDLGTIPASEAAAYFFAIIPQIERGGRRDKARFLLPAVLADDPAALPRLISLARDDSRLQETRRQAIQWIGLLGDPSVVPVLVGFARGGGAEPMGEDIDVDDEAPGKKGLATAAMAALSSLENGVGVPALIDLSRAASARTRGAAVFWLGQTGDPRAFAALHNVIENGREDERVRAHAIFSLSHGGDIPRAEFAYLRGIYPRLASDRLKESVLQGMGEDRSDGSAWLIERARDNNEPLKLRKSALFWAGQKESTPSRDLVAYYRGAADPTLREHAIFVLSQRQDEAALNELMRIAREDSDKRMRARALFWLGQKDDPRVTKMIGERVLK
jgi:HEAT repeat protein